MESLVGKVAIITGAARGQGAAEAQLFVAEGAQVVCCDISPEGADVAADLGSRARFVIHDVADEVSWGDLVADTALRYGRYRHSGQQCRRLQAGRAARHGSGAVGPSLSHQSARRVSRYAQRDGCDGGGGRRFDHQYFIERRHEERGRDVCLRDEQVGGARDEQAGCHGACTAEDSGKFNPSGHHRYTHAGRQHSRAHALF